MGLSSSQARLLSLTGRMHDIEYKAQKLEAQKLQMANESAHVYSEYQSALNKTKIQYKTIGTDGSISYNNATYQALLDNGYYIEFVKTNQIWGKEGQYIEGKIHVTTQDLANKAIAGNNKDYFIALQTNQIDSATGASNANANTYEIYTADQFINFLNSNKSGVTCRLMCDIDLSGVTYNPSNMLNVTFDGNGHKITNANRALFNNFNGGSIENLEIVNSNTALDRAILTNILQNANVSNVKVSGCSVTAPNVDNVGIITGISVDSNIKYCSVENSSVTGQKYVGGLVGQYSSSGGLSQIDNCQVLNTYVTGSGFMGGMIGLASNSQITNSIADANISIVDSNGTKITSEDHITTGGFVGTLMAGANVENCTALGVVNDNSTTSQGGIGGFCGSTYQSNNATISNCTSNVDVHVNANPPAGYSVQVGNFVGVVCGGTISFEDCDALGDYAVTVSPGIGVNGGNYFAG